MKWKTTGFSTDEKNSCHVAMYAWRRANVEALNQAARDRWHAAGRLSGPELEAPGGRRYRAGDLIVTLAPGGDGQLVTSERGVIQHVELASGAMVARMDDGRLQRLAQMQVGVHVSKHVLGDRDRACSAFDPWESARTVAKRQEDPAGSVSEGDRSSTT